MRTVYESIMKAERENFLAESSDGNKANGYYSRMIKSSNKYMGMAIPRDRYSMFKPIFLEIANKADGNIQEAAFMLYSRGLSTRYIEEFIEKILSTLKGL
jgi:putative transposase